MPDDPKPYRAPRGADGVALGDDEVDVVDPNHSGEYVAPHDPRSDEAPAEPTPPHGLVEPDPALAKQEKTQPLHSQAGTGESAKGGDSATKK